MKLKDIRPNSSTQESKNKSLIIPLTTLLFFIGIIIGRLSSTSDSYSKTPKTPPSPSPKNSTEAQTHDLFSFRTECSKAVRDEEVVPTIINLVFRNASPYDRFPSTEVSKNVIRRRPRGWGSRNRVFGDLIRNVMPKTIIELGTFLGASALTMASETRNLNLLSTAILCVDDFRGWPGFQARIHKDVPSINQGDTMLLHQFMTNVAVERQYEAAITERVIPVPFSTASALAAFCEWGIYADLIEVDAGHDFHSAWTDINMAWSVLRPGGTLFGHDYFTVADNRGVRRAVNLFREVKGLGITVNGEHWVLSPKPHA